MAALTADLPDGLPVPWVYTRSQLAQQWGCPPWGVDDAPAREVLLQLRLWRVEAQARRAQERARR